ncbi:APAF1 [Branchiostoma lanceolatum]|uniref:APAF1 protein n=1 Tax=Branchiostoma lanceolatum TaxID=7740 RepID=A0A8K0F3K0_BRALA|nr:APAF1 [Branchiostoma lanceolatum]
MDVRDRNKLRTNHVKLKTTIYTRHITGVLYQEGVLTLDDIERIDSKATEEDKTEALLFMLPRKADGAFRKFCLALKEDYAGVPLYKDLAETLEATDHGSPDNERERLRDDFPEVRKEVDQWNLLRKHRRGIATCLDTEKTCDLLINDGILTNRERSVIERERSAEERAETLLRILPTKGPNAFTAFIEALNMQNDQHNLKALLAGEPGRVVNPTTNVGKKVDHFFTSRDARKVNEAMEGARPVIVLSGITGSGKTQLALWQAQLFVERHPTAVVWKIDGQDKTSVLTDMQNLLMVLKKDVPKDDSQVDACVAKALDSRKTPVLLIIDDLDDGLLLSPALLKSRNESKILLITHRKRLQQPVNVSIPDDSYVYINGFVFEDEAVDFLRMKLQQQPTDQLQRLASKFSGLPLGLVAARSYIEKSRRSAESYLNLLEKRKNASKLEEAANEVMSRFYKKPGLLETGRNLFAALRLAVDKLKTQAKSMFQLVAYMDSRRIPMVVLKDDVEGSPDMRNLELDSLVMEVEDWSLGTVEGIDNDRVLSVHEVTQLAIRLSLTEEEKECLKKLLDILLKYFVKDNRYSRSGKLIELLSPHVGRVLEHAQARKEKTFSFALARLNEVYGFMQTQCGMPANAVGPLRAARDHLEQLAGINWHEVDLEIGNQVCSRGCLLTTEEQGYVEEKSRMEAEVLYWKLSEASKRLPDDVYTSMIQSRVMAEQDLRLFNTFGKAPDGLAQSVKNKEPLTPAQYQQMVKNGIAIPIERLKAVLLPELYASVSYSLGRCFFYLKEKYSKDAEAKERLIKSIHLAHYMSDKINEHAEVLVMHKYLSEANAVLYLRLEKEGKTPAKFREDIKYAIGRYSEFVELESGGKYFEFGILKKHGPDDYSLTTCHRQLVRCFSLLIKQSDSEEERLASFQQGLGHFRKMIEHAEKQVQRDAKGRTVERPERLANFYNTAGRFLVHNGDHTNLKEAVDWFEAAYKLEKEKGKEDYPLLDALFGLAEGLVRRKEGDDLRKAMNYVCELLELCYRKWPDRKADIDRAKKLKHQINLDFGAPMSSDT